MQWRNALSLRLRDAILRHYLVPNSPFGLPDGLVPHLPRHRPVTLVDVGANRGDFAATVAAHCGLAALVLVEPQPALAAGLRQRFTGSNSQVFNVAVSNTPGTLPFSILGSDLCSSLLRVKPDEGFSGRKIDVTVTEQRDVEVTTLDHLLETSALTRPIDLLKIDTQGNELQVLMGGRKMLSTVRLLWLEVSFRSLYEGDALFPEVHAFLGAAGFRLYSLHDVFRAADGELLQADALFIGPGVTLPPFTANP